MANPIQQSMSRNQNETVNAGQGTVETPEKETTSEKVTPTQQKQKEEAGTNERMASTETNVNAVGFQGGEPISEDRFIAPSAPSTFVFRNGKKLVAPDGVFYATTQAQLKELQAAVECGNISRYDPNTKQRLGSRQKAPDPSNRQVQE